MKPYSIFRAGRGDSEKPVNNLKQKNFLQQTDTRMKGSKGLTGNVRFK
jgi:hypothetical protein